MWCSSCQQDVPAERNPGRELRCCKCQRLFSVNQEAMESLGISDEGVSLEDMEKKISKHPPVDLYDWKITERQRQIERLITPRGQASKRTVETVHRIESAHIDSSFSKPAKRRQQAVTQATRSGSNAWFIWLLTFSGALLWITGIAASSGHPAIAKVLDSSYGNLLQFGGVGIILLSTIAAVLHTNAISRRITSQLRGLKTTTDDLRITLGSRTGGSMPSNFYADSARGASPNLLIADIQGQLDSLSARIHRESDFGQ